MEEREARAARYKAQFDAAVILDEQGAWEEALNLIDAVLAEYATGGPATYGLGALVMRANCLAKLGRDEAALAAYDVALVYYDAVSKVSLKPLAASALNEKAIVLTRQERIRDALAANDQLLDELSDAEDLKLRRLRVDACRRRWRLLLRAKRPVAALAAFRDHYRAMKRLHSDPLG